MCDDCHFPTLRSLYGARRGRQDSGRIESLGMTGVFETALTAADGARRPGADGPDRPYLSHFGLREEPFPAAVSARAYFLTSASYQVLEGLRAALASGTPLMRVCGADGVGKTLLAAMVPSVMTPEMEPVLLDAALLGADPFAVALRQALGMPETVAEPLRETLAVLATAREKNVSPVLVVDNAHLLGAEAFQALDQLLAPAVPGGPPPMQVVLIGSPHLETLLAASGFPRLRRSGGYTAELVPFTRQEAIDYIGYRLRKAQAQTRQTPLFDDPATQRLVSACCGNPRLLNVTCEAALLIAYAEGADRVAKAHADRAIDGAKMPSRLGQWLSGGRLSWVAGIAGVLIGAGVTAVVISRGVLPLPVVSAPAPMASPVTVAAADPAVPAMVSDTPSVPAPVPAATPMVAPASAGAEISGAVAPTASAPSPHADQASASVSAEAGETAVLEAPQQPAPVGAVEIIRGPTVKPHHDPAAASGVVEKPAAVKPAPDAPVVKAAADRRPPDKAPQKAADKSAEKPVEKLAEKPSEKPGEKAVAKGPEKAPAKPVEPRVVKAEPPALTKPPAAKPPAEPPRPENRLPERRETPPKLVQESGGGTSSGRQENGRWVWQ